MQAWLKAGLIGAGVMIVLSLLGLIPLPGIGCIIFLLVILAYVGIGALAAYYLPPIRDSGRAAGQGALAALIASVVYGLFSLITSLIRASMFDASEVLAQLPPEMLQQMQQQGVDPGIFFGIGGAAIFGTLCCTLGLLLGAGLGALGGLIYASAQPQ